jgi:hypothetical protein
MWEPLLGGGQVACEQLLTGGRELAQEGLIVHAVTVVRPIRGFAIPQRGVMVPGDADPPRRRHL